MSTKGSTAAGITYFREVSVPISMVEFPLTVTVPTPEHLIDLDVHLDAGNLVVLYSAREEDFQQEEWQQAELTIVKYPSEISLKVLSDVVKNLKSENGHWVSVFYRRAAQRVKNPQL